MEGLPAVQDRLAVAEDYWKRDAFPVLSSPGSAGLREARRLYVVDLLALLALQQEAGEQFDRAGRAAFLNLRYADGLYWAAESCGGSVAVQPLDWADWERYVHVQVFPAINVRRRVADPQTPYELMQYLHEGMAWFSD